MNYIPSTFMLLEVVPLLTSLIDLRNLVSSCVTSIQSYEYAWMLLDRSKLDAHVTLHNRSITGSVNQEWWTLSPNDSSDVVLIIYSDSINLPIFSFISSRG